MLDNIFHCCVQKTGSQWIKAIFADEMIQKLTGLQIYSYQSEMPSGFDSRKLTDRSFEEPFPVGTIVSPIYIDFLNYGDIPKPEDYRTFFVMRDPRDVIVSWYYSVKNSHVPIGEISELRVKFEELDLCDGLKFSTDYLDDFGIFQALQSWIKSENDPKVLIVRYEDLIGNSAKENFMSLFKHCHIDSTRVNLEKIMRKYNFKNMSSRNPGQEDKQSHLRKGISGDWKNNYSEDLKVYFKEKTGDLLKITGYEVSDDW